MTMISQRELRNDSGRVLREVESGREFTVTRRGAPVARIVPLGESGAEKPRGGLRSRPARRPPVFSVEELVVAGVSSEQILDELRGER